MPDTSKGWSIVRENLMTREGYAPYCGGETCYTSPRTHWDGAQFECRSCGWRSSFPSDFIAAYRAKWNREHAPPQAHSPQDDTLKGIDP